MSSLGRSATPSAPSVANRVPRRHRVVGYTTVVLLLGTILVIVAGLAWGSAGPSPLVPLAGDDSNEPVGNERVGDDPTTPPSMLDPVDSDGATDAQGSGELDLETDIEAMVDALEADHDITVSVTVEGEDLLVEHITDARSVGSYEAEAAQIGFAYAALLEAGHDRHLERMTVTATASADGPTLATWYVESVWVEAYLATDLTEDELTEKIEGTIERGSIMPTRLR